MSSTSCQESTSPGHDLRPRRKLATRACDSCRARRRRCIFQPVVGHANRDGTCCVRCSGLGLPCTFDVPSRNRGPKKKRDQWVVSWDSGGCVYLYGAVLTLSGPSFRSLAEVAKSSSLRSPSSQASLMQGPDTCP